MTAFAGYRKLALFLGAGGVALALGIAYLRGSALIPRGQDSRSGNGGSSIRTPEREGGGQLVSLTDPTSAAGNGDHPSQTDRLQGYFETRNADAIIAEIETLARGPESGYPGAVDLLARLCDARFQYDIPRVWGFFSNEPKPFGVWVLMHPELAPRWMRAEVAANVSAAVPDRLEESTLLTLFQHERDAEIAVLLVRGLSPTPANFDEIRIAVEQFADRRIAVRELLHRFSGAGAEVATFRLEPLTRHPSQIVCEVAHCELILLRPPATGLLVLSNPRSDERQDSNSIMAADILVSIDGLPVPESEETWKTTIGSRGEDELKVTVLRDGSLIDLFNSANSLTELDIMPIQK